MFSISNISEFGPRGGGRNFSIISEIQNILNYPRGGGVKPNWEFFPNFPVFFSDASPYNFNHLELVGGSRIGKIFEVF